MKRIVSIALSLFLTFNVIFISNVNALDEAEHYLNQYENLVPLMDSYECDKEVIREGETSNITVKLVDPNIKRNEVILKSTISVGTESSFIGEPSENKLLNTSLTYNSFFDGAEISIQLNNITYSGNGHNLKVNYHIETDQNTYDNSVAFGIKETMRVIGKNGEKPSDKDDDIKIVDDLNSINEEQYSITMTEEGPRLGADQKTLEAQQWLNQTYTGRPGYTRIPEDGVPGVVVSEALVTALQIELGIAEPTGYFGGQTATQFKNQCGRLTQGQEDGNKPYIKILQHGLFCKGYNPTAATGTFGDGTVKAVTKLKQEAGFSGTQDSSVDAMWLKAILNSDAYTCVNKGDEKIRQMQQTLNRDYHSYCGIMPCDGHYSRDTNEALIYALQAEEGLDVQTANGNFGPTTKRLCPNLPNDSRYSSDKLKTFTRILQYSLYSNKVWGYGAIQFNGNYDSFTRSSVQKFQEFACLTPADGNAPVGTIMSLMVSTGDTDRSALGCDCATQLDYTKAQALYNAGYRYVGRYLTGYVGKGVPKYLTHNEFRAISDVGMRLFPIYQDGGYYSEYFNKDQGIADAKAAIEAARNICIPTDAIIYFAVDYDFMDFQVTSRVIPYFEGVNQVMDGSEYRAGIYGSRNMCTRVSEKGYACSSFVSDMSTGYSGNYGYPLPYNWAFDQFFEYTFSGSGVSFDLDKDAVSGRDQGVALKSSELKYSNYDRNAVRAYIDRWWNSRNPDFYSYSQDCANFASQCLWAGGIPMNACWHSYKNVSDVAGQEEVAINQQEISEEEALQLNKFTSLGASWDVSAPWRKASWQYEFFSNKECGFINGDVIVINSVNEIAPKINAAAAEGRPIKVGDLMCFVNAGGPHHATIVSKMESNMICYAAHTSNQWEKDLSDGLGNEKVYIVRIKDSNT